MRLWVIIIALGLTGTVQAQGNFFEDFEDFEDIGADQGAGPSNLVQAGFLFRNQSQPGFDRRWVDGGATWFYPSWNAWSGQGFIGCKQRDTVQDGGLASNWMILPAVANQIAGDQVTFRFRGFPNSADHVQLRYSPGGGTSTGSSPQDVGDFTSLLWEEDAREGPWDEPMDDEWTLIQVDLPGSGRLAFRYVANPASALGSGSIWAFDDLQVTQNAEPPYPAPGETVHWTAQMNPIPIPEDRTIVAGGIVIVDPGAHLVFEPGAELDVKGQFQVRGSAGSLVRIDGNAANSIGGTGQESYRFASIGVRVGGEVFDRCVIRDDGIVGFPYPAIAHVNAVTTIESCLFDGGALRPLGQVLLKDCVIRPPNDPFLNPFLLGFAVIENVRLEGVGLEIGTAGGQDMLVESVEILGNSGGAGLELAGARNYLIDESVVLQGNEVPVELGFDLAGILPGSQLPKTGNTNNYIRDTVQTYDPRGSVYWADTGLPYVVEIARFVAGQTLEPGVVVQFKENGNWTIGGTLTAKGLPEKPITLQAFEPLKVWRGVIGLDRLDFTILEDANLNAGGPALYFNHCLVRNNGVGVNMVLGKTLYSRGTRYENNGTAIFVERIASAILEHPQQPNSFEGNDWALISHDDQSTMPAGYNWWGHPTGPTIFSKPSGRGDRIGGTASNKVDFTPFLTEEPDTSDTPPIVRMVAPSPVLDPGTKLIFHWNARDDGRIVSQRVTWTDNANSDTNRRLIAVLPGDQRSIEWTVQAPVTRNPIWVRVEAFDDQGQMGFDDWSASVTTRVDDPLTVTWLADLTPTFSPGERLDVCVDYRDGQGYPDTGYLLLEADRVRVPRGAVYQGCILAGITMHDYSTNLARLVVAADSGQGDWYFSDYFSIRYAGALGDAPPSIAMTFPVAGRKFYGGSTIPIRWLASDDDGELRRFDIQASYDGGRFWNDVVRDLPGTARSFDWKLPPSAGIADVRVRVIAVDRRFQNTADGWERVFSILPGDAPIQPGNPPGGRK